MSAILNSIKNLAGTPSSSSSGSNCSQVVGSTNGQQQIRAATERIVKPKNGALKGFASTNHKTLSSNLKASKSSNEISKSQAPKEEPLSEMGITKTSTADFNQWLHAMKMVSRLPGGVPAEFRKKLWLSLADRYLHTKNIDWSREEVKCLSEKWRSDDEELGNQIVKDLHRTGSSLCSGPSGSLNQAKLKRVLVGYARFNPEVGYCQGFNMLGALILQVLDKGEADAIKVMIYLIEGILPPGYFCGSLTGLQADMSVFRELLSTKLPKLSKHLQKLQGQTAEAAFEPPLTNVFTMQWFLTIFCTCLPINCVLRIWDLILIEGGDVLLRTALVLWGLLENKIINTRSADDFYCKMGLLSGELLNGNLIDSNGLVQRVVDMGPISDLQKMRDRHLYNIAPLDKRDKKGIRLFYSDDEQDSDDDSKMAVATAWGLRVNRRGSAGLPTVYKSTPDNKDRIALDINLLKQQYEKLRERQRQAHIILTTACARQVPGSSQAGPLPMNQLLMGRSAILSNKGRRIGPPQGAIPPARKTPSKTKNPMVKAKRGETLHWKDTDLTKKRRNSLKWKDIPPVDKLGDKQVSDIEYEELENPEPKTRKSESSSYSEDSDAASSTSTSLCDDENQSLTRDSGSSLETSPFIKKKISPDFKVPEEDKLIDIQNYIDNLETESKYEIISFDSLSKEEKEQKSNKNQTDNPLNVRIDDDNSLFVPITSTSQLSPIADLSQYLTVSTISPLKTPSTTTEFTHFLTNISPSKSESVLEKIRKRSEEEFTINDEGVINQLFERMNSTERPSKLEIPVFDPPKKSKTRPLSEILSSSLDYSFNTSLDSKMDYRESMSNSMEKSEKDEFSSLISNRDKILRGKSSSLDEPRRNLLERKQPISCPEGTDGRNSERALKIIQENSKILHRILKKNSTLDEEPVIEEASNCVEEETPIKEVSIEEEVDLPIVKPLKKNSPPASISATISSIENTIKSINSLCQERESYEVRSRRNRLMNSIEEIINAPAVVVRDCSNERDDLSCPKSDSLRVSPLSSLSPSIRGSRDASRDPSPRRRHQDDKEEYENRVRRQTIHFFEDNERKSSPTSPVLTDRTPIRTAPVTSTMYDRYLTQQSDPTPRMDKSPSSPVITRSYLESLRPVPSTRVTKSAENSPSRSSNRDELKTSYHGETLYSAASRDKDKYEFLKLSPPSSANRDRRSFDNIPYHFESHSSTAPPYRAKYSSAF